ncbi:MULTISPECIES: hypothetical protein [Methylotenera]|uniref:hypothetical protein n=1 Tax=Methylotenera TaxID=359407 RepID=UPI0003802AC1|nr:MULTISPECIES: hypothetical protein [Methylotenera]
MSPQLQPILNTILTLTAILFTGALLGFIASQYFGETREDKRWILRGATILTVLIAGSVHLFLLSNKT